MASDYVRHCNVSYTSLYKLRSMNVLDFPHIVTNVISQSCEGSNVNMIWPNLILSICWLIQSTGQKISGVSTIHLTAQKMHSYRLTIISGFVSTEYNRNYI